MKNTALPAAKAGVASTASWPICVVSDGYLGATD
jgi:hypothetical protein